MALFCIPKQFVDKVKDAAFKDDLNISALYDMGSEARKAFFAAHTDADIGKFLNTKFEKAVVSENVNALRDFAESLLDPKAKVSNYTLILLVMVMVNSSPLHSSINSRKACLD